MLKKTLGSSAPPVTGERFEELLRHKNVLVERIVSSANITPKEYIQPQDEWVLLLQGKATLEVAGEGVELSSGEHLFLPAHTPHTVLSVEEGTLWLAVHLFPETSEMTDCLEETNTTKKP